MRCRCGQYIDDKFIKVHKEKFCEAQVYFSFREFLAWKPRLIISWAIGMGAWCVYWAIMLINGI